jgi:hypothetical protein
VSIAVIHVTTHERCMCKYVKKTVFGVGFRHLPVVTRAAVHVPCITIIDTIILNIHTNDAYYSDTYLW